MIALTNLKTNAKLLVNEAEILYVESVAPSGIPIIGEAPKPPNTQIVFKGGESGLRVKESLETINQLTKK